MQEVMMTEKVPVVGSCHVPYQIRGFLGNFVSSERQQEGNVPIRKKSDPNFMWFPLSLVVLGFFLLLMFMVLSF